MWTLETTVGPAGFFRLVGEAAQAGQNRLDPLCLCTLTGRVGELKVHSF